MTYRLIYERVWICLTEGDEIILSLVGYRPFMRHATIHKRADIFLITLWACCESSRGNPRPRSEQTLHVITYIMLHYTLELMYH